MKKKDLLYVVGGAFAFWFVLNMLHYVGLAHAQGVTASSGSDSTSQIVDLLTTGQYLPAIGAILVALVSLIRAGAMKIQWKGLGTWFGTQLGGYVLGYGVTMVTYLGTALEQKQPITLKLVLMGATAALTASGVLDHFRDFAKMKKAPIAAAPMLALFLLGGLVLACDSGCPGWTQSKPVQDVVSCVELNQTEILQVGTDCKDKPTWSDKESCVVAEIPSVGWKVGGCVLADLVQQYLTTRGIASQDSHSAHDVLEDFRSKYTNGATFRTSHGDL